jgi:hypothetical protein
MGHDHLPRQARDKSSKRNTQQIKYGSAFSQVMVIRSGPTGWAQKAQELSQTVRDAASSSASPGGSVASSGGGSSTGGGGASSGGGGGSTGGGGASSSGGGGSTGGGGGGSGVAGVFSAKHARDRWLNSCDKLDVLRRDDNIKDSDGNPRMQVPFCFCLRNWHFFLRCEARTMICQDRRLLGVRNA